MTKEAITIPRPDDVLLQKNRSSLLCSGNALITFSVWTIIRSVIQLYVFVQNDIGMQDIPFAAVILIVLALGGIDLVLKLIVGLSARAEGLGRRKKDGYVILGIILAAVTIIWLISQLPLISTYYRSDGLLNVLVSLAVELTVLFAEIDLVVSAINVRKIEKERARRES